jgi:hypothetical protein
MLGVECWMFDVLFVARLLPSVSAVLPDENDPPPTLYPACFFTIYGYN